MAALALHPGGNPVFCKNLQDRQSPCTQGQNNFILSISACSGAMPSTGRAASVVQPPGKLQLGHLHAAELRGERGGDHSWKTRRPGDVGRYLRQSRHSLTSASQPHSCWQEPESLSTARITGITPRRGSAFRMTLLPILLKTMVGHSRHPFCCPLDALKYCAECRD